MQSDPTQIVIPNAVRNLASSSG